jgi:LPXTG-motif cell wall-anchored protein
MKRTLIGASVFALLLATTSATPAVALATEFGVDIYMSAPTVQGSAASGIEQEEFNSQAAGACSSSLGVGTVSGGCEVSVRGDYGGASASAGDPSPTTLGVGSNYAYTSGGSTTMTIDLAEPARYLGFWWSAGSETNDVELYSGDELVGQMSTQTLMTLLEAATVTTVAGGSYDSSDYFGNPRNGAAPTEPFAYLNLYATGGAVFDRVVLSGVGFEFDNLVVSNLAQTPLTSEVPIEFIPGENAPPAPVTPEAELPKTGIDAAGIILFAGILMSLGVVAITRRLAKA